VRKLIPNSTQVPDVILDVWMARLTGSEFKVLMYIARRTYGFGKEGDSISLRQLEDGIVTRAGQRLDSGTGLNKDTIAKALSSLEEKGLVIRVRRDSAEHGHLSNFYRLNLEADDFGDDEGDDGGGNEPKTPASGPLSENPTSPPEESATPLVGKSDKPPGKKRQALVGKSDTPLSGFSDTQETAEQETEEQETATTTVAAFSASPLHREEGFSLLMKEGFLERDARSLAQRHTPTEIQNQIVWLPKRSVSKNRLGMLRRAIEEAWPSPESPVEQQKRVEREAKVAAQIAEDARRQEISSSLRRYYVRLQTEAQERFMELLAHIEKLKADQALRPLIKESPKRLELMQRGFDEEPKRIELMVEYFKDRPEPLPGFRALIDQVPMDRLGSYVQ
jgi:DNA-binding transcriptional ArsR family regulator